MALAKSLYSIPTWTRTVALVSEHAALRKAMGGEVPSVYACYRFATKLRRYGDLLDACIGRVTVSLRGELPEYGYRVHAAVCARTDLPLAWEVSTAASHESNYVSPLPTRRASAGSLPRRAR